MSTTITKEYLIKFAENNGNNFELVNEMINEGYKYIYPERINEFNLFLYNSLLSFSRGSDFVIVIEILQSINDNIPETDIIENLKNKMLTGIIENGVIITLFYLAKNGPLLYEIYKDYKLNNKEINLVESKKIENKKLEEINNKRR